MKSSGIIYNNKYLLKSKLNHGEFGYTLKVINILSDEICTLKKIINAKECENLEETCRDVSVLTEISHPLIAEFYETFSTKSDFHIVMKFYSNGSLSDRINERISLNKPFEFESIFLWTYECADALNFLHSNKIIHRDVKPSNIFLTENDTLKLGDFGQSRLMGLNKVDSTTLNYMSPEMKTRTNYSFRTDIWSLGCVIYELITLKKYSDKSSSLKNLIENNFKNLQNDIKKQFSRILYSMLFKYEKNRVEAKDIKEYLEIFKSDISIEFLNNANSFFHSNNHKDALKCYVKAIELDPNCQEAYFNKALSLASLNKHTEAVECLNSLILLNPNYNQVYYQKGLSLQNLNKHLEAIECFDKMIELKPNHFLAYNNKGSSLAELERNEEAVECYDKAIEIDPKFYEAYYNKGLSLTYLKRNLKAIESYDKAIELNPKFYQAYSNKGSSLVKLNKLKLAIKNYDTALKIKPDDLIANNNKGAILQYLGNHQKAIDYFDKAIKIDPNYHKAYFNKGISLGYLNKFKNAIECFDKAIQLNPKFYQAYNHKGFNLTRLNRNIEAIECYNMFKLIFNEANPVK